MGDAQNRSDQPNQKNSDPWHTVSISGRHRLDVASALLAEGEAEAAAQIAGPVVQEGPSGDLVAFIVALRTKNAATSDLMLSQLVTATSANPNADANSILLLTAPLVSPGLLVVVDENGSTSFRSLTASVDPSQAQRPIDANLRQTILGTSADILLRGSSRLLSGAESRSAIAYYFALARLKPMFDSMASQFSAAVEARLNELSSLVRDGPVKRMLTAQSSLTADADVPRGDPLKGQADELAHAGSSASRDHLAVGIIKVAVRNRFWDRAKRTAAEISDPSLDRASTSFITVSEIADILHTYEGDKENDFEPVLRYLRTSGAPSFAMAWGFAQSSELAARKGEKNRASQLVGEAESFASETPAGTMERLLAYEAVTLAAVQFRGDRVGPLLREAVQSANSIDGFRGDEETLALTTDSNLPASDRLSVDISSIQLETVFSKVAKLNFDEAAAGARSIDGPIPRLLSLNAVARTVLSSSQ